MNPSDVRLFFIGSVLPDDPAFHTSAFSRAGNMCQHYLIHGLINAGIHIDKIISVYPIPTFPTTRKLFFRSRSIQFANNLSIKLIPFLNFTPIKQVCFGLAAFYEIIKWGMTIDKSSQRIVYTFNISVPPGIFVILASKLIGAKVVAMIYDINVPGETVPRSYTCLLDYWLHRKLLPKYDGLVVITDNIAKDFAPEVPFLRVEGGIKSDLVDQYSHFDSQTNCNKDYFTIVAAGGMEEANGVREILTAFSLLPGERYRIFIAGDGPLESEVRKAALSDSRINYLGFISFTEVLKLYAKADVLVNMRLTKRLNTQYFFPSKIMEYLTTGVPVISTCPGNMAEEYGHFAYLLHDETPESLADMIKYIESIPKPECRKRSLSARQYMVENKTWDAQSRRIADFLVSNLNGNNESNNNE